MQTTRFVPPNTILVVCFDGELLYPQSLFTEFLKKWPNKECPFAYILEEGLKQKPPYIVLTRDYRIYGITEVEQLTNLMKGVAKEGYDPRKPMFNKYKQLLFSPVVLNDPKEQELYELLDSSTDIFDRIIPLFPDNDHQLDSNGRNPKFYDRRIDLNFRVQANKKTLMNVEFRGPGISSQNQYLLPETNIDFSTMAKFIAKEASKIQKKLFGEPKIKWKMTTKSDTSYEIRMYQDEEELIL